MTLAERLPLDNRPRKARLTRDQFYLICESGAFDDYAKTELLNGEIHVMNSQYLPHMRVKRTILMELQRSLQDAGSPFEVGVEGAIELGLRNVPEPDVFIFDAPDARQGAPDGSVKLVVEVADSSERRDLGVKKRIYAKHGIAEYWVALLRTRTIVRFTEPEGNDYRRRDDFAFGDEVRSLTVAGAMLAAGVLKD